MAMGRPKKTWDEVLRKDLETRGLIYKLHMTMQLSELSSSDRG